ncbi:MAG: hypothetical protein DRJ97_07820 [Thermoprotei archaeon]|nr:MAG: hypothetical protein DRJ97_07820 [Thermoprotei archaeon]
MPSLARRSKLEVCLDILNALAKKSMGLTRLSLEVNVNYVALKKYLDLLVNQGLVREVVDEKGRKFCVTERGLTALSYFLKLKTILSVEKALVKEA